MEQHTLPSTQRLNEKISDNTEPDSDDNLRDGPDANFSSNRKRRLSNTAKNSPLSRVDLLKLERSSVTSNVSLLRGRHRYLLLLQDLLNSVARDPEADRTRIWATLLETQYS